MARLSLPPGGEREAATRWRRSLCLKQHSGVGTVARTTLQAMADRNSIKVMVTP